MKLKITTLFIAFASLFVTNAMAQDANENPLDTLTRSVAAIRSELDVLKRIKVSGYIQSQLQFADSTGESSYAGGNFAAGVDKRFMVRRGRIKFQYDGAAGEKGWSTAQYVLQFDVTEKGLTIKDAYGKFTDPCIGWFSLTAGMQNRPFGYEIPYSSSMRESPERGRMSQIIFPNERDLGMMLTIQGPKTSNWNWLKIDAGMFNGTGAPDAGSNTADFDKYKDFIGHIGVSRSAMQEKIKWGVGASYYAGGFRNDSSDVYRKGVDTLGTAGFYLYTKKVDNKINQPELMRTYVGGDAQFSIDWAPGITTIRGEYIQGQQPGLADASSIGNAAASTKSPVAPVTKTMYIRNFNGAYFYFLQNILQTPFQAIVKYDWYDPNTDIAGDAIGKVTKNSSTNTYAATTAADLKYTTIGVGLAYRFDANVKITAYYDMVTNETTSSPKLDSSGNVTHDSSGNTIYNIPGYQKDFKDNVFTLRVQVKF